MTILIIIWTHGCGSSDDCHTYSSCAGFHVNDVTRKATIAVIVSHAALECAKLLHGFQA